MQRCRKQASLRNGYTTLVADYIQERWIRGHQTTSTCGKSHFSTNSPPSSRQSRNFEDNLNRWWHHRFAIRWPQWSRYTKVPKNRDEQACERSAKMVVVSDNAMIMNDEVWDTNINQQSLRASSWCRKCSVFETARWKPSTLDRVGSPRENTMKLLSPSPSSI